MIIAQRRAVCLSLMAVAVLAVLAAEPVAGFALCTAASALGARGPAAPAARPAKPAGHLRYTCLRCKHRFEEPKVQKEGSLLAELFYWAISPVAGGFYTAGRVLGTKQLCPKCDSEQLNDEPW